MTSTVQRSRPAPYPADGDANEVKRRLSRSSGANRARLLYKSSSVIGSDECLAEFDSGSVGQVSTVRRGDFNHGSGVLDGSDIGQLGRLVGILASLSI